MDKPLEHLVLRAEVDLWKVMWLRKSYEDTPTTVAASLHACDKSTLSNHTYPAHNLAKLVSKYCGVGFSAGGNELGGLGARCKLTQRGPGQSPGKFGFWSILGPQKSRQNGQPAFASGRNK